MLYNLGKLVVIGSCVILIAGCSRTSTHYVTPGGVVDVTKSGKGDSDVKITTDKGTMEVNKKVDLSSLGVPIYPGATQKEGGSVSSSMQDKGKNASYQMVTLVSSDPFDKVAAYYKDQYKDKIDSKKANVMEMNSNGSKMTHIMLNEDNLVTAIIIQEASGKTQIMISKSTK